MAVLAIVTSSPPGTEGGHLVIAESPARLLAARALSRRLGEPGFAEAARMTWRDAVRRLVIV